MALKWRVLSALIAASAAANWFITKTTSWFPSKAIPSRPFPADGSAPRERTAYELLTHPNRELKVKYRRPFSKKWESLDLETAMDMIADRVWDARERIFCRKAETAKP